MDKGEAWGEIVLRAALLGEAIKFRAQRALWLGLCSEEPNTGGGQDEQELDYTGYARVRVPRNEATFKFDGPQATLAVDVIFPLCAAGEAFATHAILGVEQSGGGIMLYRLRARLPIEIVPGVRPVVPAGSLTIVEH